MTSLKKSGKYILHSLFILSSNKATNPQSPQTKEHEYKPKKQIPTGHTLPPNADTS
jgi:hypothetical protein